MTVDEASLLCESQGLSRTKKTIRGWARNGHVASHKQTTATGAMWVLDASELKAKIKAELEFAKQQAEVRKGANHGEPVQTGSYRREPVQTRSNRSEPVRTSMETGVDSSGDRSALRETIRSLTNQIQTLSIDVKWRDKMLDKLSTDNEALLGQLHGQARYIGHLETDLLRLGGEPDQQFLAAPEAKGAASFPEILVPDQSIDPSSPTRSAEPNQHVQGNPDMV